MPTVKKKSGRDKKITVSPPLWEEWEAQRQSEGVESQPEWIKHLLECHSERDCLNVMDNMVSTPVEESQDEPSEESAIDLCKGKSLERIKVVAQSPPTEEVRRIAQEGKDEDNKKETEDKGDGELVVVVAPVTGQTGERAEGSAASLPLLKKPSRELRPVIIDGCNVAMSHGSRPGRNPVYSCCGIKIVVKYFWKRGHQDIKAIVPQWRLERTDKEDVVAHHILHQLDDEGYLLCSPSRQLTTGEYYASYPDRCIIQLAAETGGIVVSNDYFRDLHRERREWREVIDTRVVMYSFHGDLFIPTDDPLGKGGPNLDEFLKFPERNRQNHVLSPRTFTRNDPGERPQMAPQSRLTAAATTNFHPNVAPVQQTAPGSYSNVLKTNLPGVKGPVEPCGPEPKPNANMLGDEADDDEWTTVKRKTGRNKRF